MYSLNLTIEELQALQDVLECSISELHSEILHTDHREFKGLLKERKQVLLKMLTSLKAQTVIQEANLESSVN